MDRATISRIEAWDSLPVSGGYVGLHDLADEEFTGAVSTGGAYLFMLNGRVVGVEDGSMSSFEDADATAYRAPDPALPLLFAMLGRGGEVRGSYYTDDTPIREVDRTLTEGGFTGYLELSENVLSGDYYVVYYGGRSLAAAFVGNKGRVVSGDEAMELAADEVGIYEVTAVDLDVSEVPEPPDGAVAAASTGTDEGSAADPSEDEAAVGDAPVDEEDGKAASPEPDVEEREPAVDEAEPEVEETEPAVEEAEPVVEEAEADEEDGATADADDEPDAEIVDAEGDGGESAVAEAEAAEEPAGPTADASSAGDDAESGGEQRPAASSEAKPAEPDERFEEEARWREARTVPALDPEDSEKPQGERRPEEPEPPAPREPTPDADPNGGQGEVEALEERLGRLEARLESNEGERQRLDDRLSEVAEERDALEAERDELADRVDRLERRLEEAQAAAASAGGADGGRTAGTGGGQRVDPKTALDQTDLFVRYGSKGKPTLDTAHDGRADAEEVAENLRIDSHSRFDPSTATVDGRPFDEFLSGTIQYRFVSWLVEVLLYEIRDTGSEAGLQALYDVLPEIDRAEFNGTVTSTDEEGEQDTREFDVVCRNRMGKPLIVANINESLDPATGDMMGTLVEDATEVAEGQESIGAAFLVTASFFQPGALETAEEATRGGGFLSRDSKKSFVKLSRNGGYHLCLVEARGDDFHVAVPEF